MEQDRLKEQQKAKEAGEDVDEVVKMIQDKSSGAMTKKQKVEQSENYWQQFGNGDIFSQTVKKKSKLELDKENASKARLKAREKELKQKNQKGKGKDVVLLC